MGSLWDGQNLLLTPNATLQCQLMFLLVSRMINPQEMLDHCKLKVFLFGHSGQFTLPCKFENPLIFPKICFLVTKCSCSITLLLSRPFVSKSCVWNGGTSVKTHVSTEVEKSIWMTNVTTNELWSWLCSHRKNTLASVLKRSCGQWHRWTLKHSHLHVTFFLGKEPPPPPRDQVDRRGAPRPVLVLDQQFICSFGTHSSRCLHGFSQVWKRFAHRLYFCAKTFHEISCTTRCLAEPFDSSPFRQVEQRGDECCGAGALPAPAWLH